MSKHENIAQQGGDTRCPNGVSYQQLLDLEEVAVPTYLRENTCPDMGDEDLDIARYTSREFHLREARDMWSRVWQMACREDEIPEPGDHVVYDIVDRSAIVVRSEDGQIRAFVNSCLHRGRALRDEDGHVKQFRCPFHGFTWSLDGEYKGNACEWDFRHLQGCDMRLPQLRVGQWGGFVFINFDENAGPLEDFLGVVPEHFARFPLEDYYTGVHVQRVVKCNWKSGAEAFMESWHTVETHPQIMPFTGDCNSQYDCFGDNVSRSVTPMATASPHLQGISEQMIMSSILTYSGRMAIDNAEGLELPPGKTARQYIGELNRQMFGEAAGQDFPDATMAELEDAILYSVFPNFQVWIGYCGNIVYRFRPNGDDHDSCIFDVYLLLRYRKGEQERPPAVHAHVLHPDEPFSSAEELGALGEVFDQDMANLDAIQKGMRASKKGRVSLASYQESRIRHLHVTLDKYLRD